MRTFFKNRMPRVCAVIAWGKANMEIYKLALSHDSYNWDPDKISFFSHKVCTANKARTRAIEIMKHGRGAR